MRVLIVDDDPDILTDRNRIKIALMTITSEFSECFDKVFFKPLEFNRLFEYVKDNWID